MRLRRKHWWIVAAACCVLAYSSVNVNWPRHCRLVDGAGGPVKNAFVFYYYSAGPKTIWPWAHGDGPFFTRSDADGRFAIPFKAHLRFPLITLRTPVRAYVSAYVPRLHNSCELFDPAETESYCAKPLTEAGECAFRVADLSARSPGRFRTLWLLLYGQQTLAQRPGEGRRELIDAARAEYNQFLAEYGDVIFENSPNQWGHIKVLDWTKESGERRRWRFFLQEVPFYGATMGKRLAEIERQIR